MFVPVPKVSFFPEIAFASKCVGRTEMPNLLGPLNNADSGSLCRRLSGRTFYIGDVGGGQIA
jgi:hypothetical protein